MKNWVILCFVVYSGFQTFSQEKTFNYFIGIQPKFSMENTGKASFFKTYDFANYTNKGGYSYGVNLQNGISIKKWDVVLNIGFHKKIMSQTFSFIDGYTPTVFNEIRYDVPYAVSEINLGRRINLTNKNAVQLTIGLGAEKNLETNFAGDFTSPKDTIYYQYNSSVSNKIRGYFNFKLAFVMPFNQNELLFGVSVNSVIEERLDVQILSPYNTGYGAPAIYIRKSAGVFLTYRFL